MSRKTVATCALLLLGTVGLLTTLPYAEAQPLGSWEVTVTATIPEYAEASLAGDIVVTETHAGTAEGSTAVNTLANFAYHVSVHWLEGHVWNPGYYAHVSSDVSGDHDPADAVSGLVTVEVIVGTPFPDNPPVGTAEGSKAHDEASVQYPAGTEVGKVQVTVSHQ